MHYYVIAEVTHRNDVLPTKYWWGPFTMTQARDEWEKRLDMYPLIKIVKDITL